jgi:hypothetical protein
VGLTNGAGWGFARVGAACVACLGACNANSCADPGCFDLTSIPEGGRADEAVVMGMACVCRKEAPKPASRGLELAAAGEETSR